MTATTERRPRPSLRDRRPRPFDVNGETLSVRVRESPRAQTARIILGPRRPLEIIVPRGAGDTAVDAFLEDKRAWIERKLDAARAIAARPAQLGLDQRGVVWVGGRPIAVDHRRDRRAVAAFDDGRLAVGGDERQALRAIERWYRREARARVAAVAQREAQRLALAYRSIAIRDSRTRWGSCSQRGNLSFSWRLVVAPADVLEYVVVHELCHLREPSHQKPFWRLLDSARPGWQEQARWLRAHGQELHDYTPADALANYGG